MELTNRGTLGSYSFHNLNHHSIPQMNLEDVKTVHVRFGHCFRLISPLIWRPTVTCGAAPSHTIFPMLPRQRSWAGRALPEAAPHIFGCRQLEKSFVRSRRKNGQSRTGLELRSKAFERDSFWKRSATETLKTLARNISSQSGTRRS